MEITGKNSLADFYRKKRMLKGRHMILRVRTAGNRVIVRGEFEGGGDDFVFTDEFVFSPQGKIIKRKSVLHGFKEKFKKGA